MYHSTSTPLLRCFFVLLLGFSLIAAPVQASQETNKGSLGTKVLCGILISIAGTIAASIWMRTGQHVVEKGMDKLGLPKAKEDGTILDPEAQRDIEAETGVDSEIIRALEQRAVYVFMQEPTTTNGHSHRGRINAAVPPDFDKELNTKLRKAFPTQLEIALRSIRPDNLAGAQRTLIKTLDTWLRAEVKKANEQRGNEIE